MCGIVGYVGRDLALPIVLGALERLEYRGYDSAGVALIEDGKLIVEKKKGKIRELVKALWGKDYKAKTGIGHTRWATHGKPTDENAHPHTDEKGEFAVVHNGIIENYLELKEELKKEGVKFRSETDTEVIAHLIAKNYRGDLLEAVLKTVKKLKGAFAFAVITVHEPNRLIGVKQGSPLIVGLGEGENFLASDIPAILPYTKKIIVLDDGEIADLTPDTVNIYNFEGEPVSKEVMITPWDLVSAEKGGFKHFMLKEIYEQPKAINDTLKGFLSTEDAIPFKLKDFRRVLIIACGTSYHAGFVGKYWIERFAGVPTEVIYASEFRYADVPVSDKDIVIGISQSGETADTKFALQSAKEKGAFTVGLVNVVGSAIDRESDFSLHTHAGPEIGVAATKTFTAQLTALYALSVRESEERENLIRLLEKVPSLVEQTLNTAEEVEKVAEKYMKKKNMLYLGRYLNYPIALEGALKLKEISYIHAEGYPAGEMKHGPIALIDENMPVVVIAPKDRVYEKILSNVEEVLARKGRVISVGFKGDETLKSKSESVMEIPKAEEPITPFLTVIPLQLFAYFIASKLGLDVDQPRNLAKTVTVE
ncbi:glutamine--fructose-6-phosphate transaminase (isomerizing) [Aquifex aeolicus]|uniref:Glutamine--fructose-6-phosphate aminotransferase [isomerizing] n=1 Tax=Aquifex aeolicus (strain VF5) TaxID=224324 RepID=GLMS_AQUAE|nr:glutamine--fructose-6-phosphate transaminase (isomerizing) [Aquifex aeolicus]O66648.3 RecName: Full=Glutamine--fructose-6-phosphate aminotransferase [isomerizing]; AltName: Full=D-fructose-6-phosphate amidotransferase; AltName: Full=GFAT; AltName: Full=Glucosamine-6-phosphate synthase; AltName: Full=Hexosephosphate aminotransferase; AltName: Full=L-glutamine--D-fructose-6-phosphate amidotransferase [Aquifex aeolicus VF5]AAC06609.1 glucosamine-fructose-6-phosphate aminotransferase [Aquifex aeol